MEREGHWTVAGHEVRVTNLDKVLIPAPAWVSYPQIVSLCRAEPVLVPGDPEWGLKVSVRVTGSKTGFLPGTATSPSLTVKKLATATTAGLACIPGPCAPRRLMAPRPRPWPWAVTRGP